MEEKKKGKDYWFLGIGLLTLMICITGATYAYFALTASNNSVTGTVGGATLSLSVDKILPTDATTNMIPQLESTLDEAISDSFNCVDEHNNVVCQVYKATITNLGNTSSELTGTIKFFGISNIPNLKWMRLASEDTMGTYSSFNATTTNSIFEDSKLFTHNESKDYYFVFWVDETGEEQEDNGTFNAEISFNTADGEGITSTIRPKATDGAKYVEDLYNDGSELTTVRIGGLDTKPAVTLNENQGIMLDNNGDYRYYGADPNNYVEFNGELWRIISVSNIKTNETDIAGRRRIKLIRNESIGNYSWDSSASTINSGKGVNEWSTADLNTELNTLYYNKQSGTCYNGGNNASTTCDFTSIGLSDTAKTLIDDAVWNLGGSSGAYDVYSSDYYISERGTTVYNCTTDSCGGARSTSWTGKVGLMYISDYMYAADLSVCTGIRYDPNNTGLDYRNTNCKGTDWLYNSSMDQWTLSPNSGNAGNAFNVSSTGYVYGNYATSQAYGVGVRPTVFLKSNVTISGGEGTDDEPYQLSISE